MSLHNICNYRCDSNFEYDTHFVCFLLDHDCKEKFFIRYFDLLCRIIYIWYLVFECQCVTKTFLFNFKFGVGSLLVLSKLSFRSSFLFSVWFCPFEGSDLRVANGVFGLYVVLKLSFANASWSFFGESCKRRFFSSHHFTWSSNA